MKMLLGSVLAAIVTTLWGFLSWAVLGWHMNGMHSFKSEAVVAEVLRENATNGHGIYMLPWRQEPRADTPAEEKARMERKNTEAMNGGPYAYAIVRPGKAVVSMSKNVLLSLLRGFIAALILSALMHHLAQPYIGRVTFVAAAGAFAGLVADMPMWIWFENPTRQFVVDMADHVIEWTLAGMVLGIFVGKDPVAER